MSNDSNLSGERPDKLEILEGATTMLCTPVDKAGNPMGVGGGRWAYVEAMRPAAFY